MKKNVCAVVVTYNRKNLLEECLDALLNQSISLKKIIVVDNNSNDGTKEYLKRYLTSKLFEIIFLEDNIGGAGGFNVGLKKAKDIEADWIWLMDDDTIPSPNAIEAMISNPYVMENYDKIGFLASNVMWINGEFGLLNVPRVSKGWNKYAHKGLINLQTSTFVSFLVRRDVVKQIGLPIKDFFIWGDDTEYSNRISSTGLECYMVCDSFVTHKRSLAANIDIISEENVNRLHFYKYAARNWMYLARKEVIGSKWIYSLKVLRNTMIIVFKCNNKRLRLTYYLGGTVKGIFFNPKIEK